MPTNSARIRPDEIGSGDRRPFRSRSDRRKSKETPLQTITREREETEREKEEGLRSEKYGGEFGRLRVLLRPPIRASYEHTESGELLPVRDRPVSRSAQPVNHERVRGFAP